MNAQSPSTCSHVLIWVRDLHQAVTNFRAAGFQVDYATAQARAQHAHIWFSQGPIIELLTTPRHAWLFKWPIDCLAGRGSGRRMLRWASSGEGFCDLALLCDDQALVPRLKGLTACGVQMGRTVNWRRTCENGSHTRFRFVYPRHDHLPFLVTPYRPNQHPAQRVHPNGATGLASIHLGVHPADHTAINLLAGDDPLLRIQPAEQTGIQAVEIAGLAHPLNLHGARLLGCPAAQGESHA
ncbi:VOC family protein [Pseudomonas sp. B21-028]|uniref:VOC family protein n=1 Tax=Pseudomonas sp. B21-028 TaxID=2895480 RepID=UPI002160ECD7|nr:VOC family protein [Pseudomonas sp. B21-028]UVL86289.1 VOC family protein [Pseudomonas sp. B21-028]